MLRLFLTPSANDTFTFHAVLNNLVPFDTPLAANFLDLQQLNESVLAGEPDVCKISVFTLGHILKDYIMLPVGAAVGFNNGPKIVAKTPFSADDLIHKSMAIPGKDTTAYLLLNVLLDRPKSERFCSYAQLLPFLETDEVDSALLIHESRFLIEEKGLHEIIDLGKLWEEKTSCPLPLGCVVAKRSLGEEAHLQIAQGIQRSLGHALLNPESSRPFVFEKSLEKDQSVIDQSIHRYVNNESWHVSQKGIESVEALLTSGRSLGLLPNSAQPWLFQHPTLAEAQYPVTLH